MGDKNVFNTTGSKLWQKIVLLFDAELKTQYSLMRQDRFTVDNIMKYLYDEQISQIPAYYYNKDMQSKYLNFGSSYLYALHGSGEQHIRKWIRERLMYVDTLLGYRTSSSDYITLRSSKLGEVYLDIETYIPMYVSVKWRDEANNTGLQTKRVGRGEKVRFTYNMPTATDQEIIIYAGHYLKRLGDVSNLQPTSMLIANADRLTEIVCHSPNLINTDLSECTKLQRIDLSDCTALGTGIGAQPILNIQNCKYLRYCDCRNTQLTAIYTMQAGGNLEEIYYPQSTQVVQLTNQTYLHTVGLPSTNPCENLADVMITNCNAIKTLSSETTVLDFNTLKYVQNLNITNSLSGLNSMQFNGFDKLRNVTLSSLKELDSIGFEDMMPVTTTSTLKNITISDCPLITSLSFNVSSDDYKVAFASNGKLDLGGLQSLKSIECNTSVKGLDTLIVPTSLTDLRFTTEYGDGINEIKNIWSASAVHNGDGFEGIDFQDMTIEFIDMLGLNGISNAINFHIAPKTQNPNLNTARDGSESKPWFHPIGSIDLSNYTGLMIGMLRGIDLNKLDVVINTDRDQTDLTSLFECATLPTAQNIVTKTNNILAKFPKSVIWDYMFKGCDLSFSPKDITIPNRGLSLKGMYKDSNVTEDVSLPNVVMAVDEMFMNCTGITTYEENWLKTYAKLTFTVPTSNGTSGSWDDNGNYTEGTNYNQFLYTPSDGERAFKIMTTGTGVVRINYFYNASFMSRIVYTPEFDSYPYVVTIPDGCNKVIFVCDKSIRFASEGAMTTSNCYTNTGGALSEIPVSWGGYGLDKNVTSIYVIDTTLLTNTTTFNLVVNDNQAGITDWGDGVTNSEKSHTYAEHGVYTIKTKSSSHGYAPSNDLQTALIEIKQIKLIGHNGNTQQYSQMFLGCGNLRKVTAYNLAPSNCNSMFKSCSSLAEIVGMDTWDMSDCKSISSIFEGCVLLSSIEGIDTWNTSKFEDLFRIFFGCKALNDISFISNWDLSNVRLAGFAFNNCSGLTGELSLQLNIPKCVSLNSFLGSTNITSLNVTGWNIPLVDDVGSFIGSCYNLTSVTGFETWNIGNNLKNMATFAYNTKLTSLNLSGWDFTNVTDIGSALPSTLTTVTLNNVVDNRTERTSDNGLRGFLNTGGLKTIVMDEFAMTDFSNLFLGVTKIKNDIVFPSNATNVSNCFNGCIGITHIHSNWKTTYDAMEDTTDCYLGCTGVTHCDGVECYKLDEVPISWGGYGLLKDRTLIVEINIPEDNYTIDLGQCYTNYPYTNDNKWYTNFGDGSVDVGYHDGSDYVNIGAISHTYVKAGTYILKTQRLLYHVGKSTRSTFTKIINAHRYLGVWGIKEHFRNCDNLVEADLSNLAGISFNALALLSDCPKLQKVIAPNFKPSDCNSLFNGCSSLTEIIGMETWDMSKNGRLSSSFYNCRSLPDSQFAKLSNINTSNIDNYVNAFNGCSLMTNNDFMKNWVIKDNSSFENTFANCDNLLTVDLSERYLTKVASIRYMFSSCPKLKTINLENFLDSSNFSDCNITNNTWSTERPFNDCRALEHNPYEYLKDIPLVGIYFFVSDNNVFPSIMDLSTYNTSNIQIISTGGNKTIEQIIGVNSNYPWSLSFRDTNVRVLKNLYFKRANFDYYYYNSPLPNTDITFVTKEGSTAYKSENFGGQNDYNGINYLLKLNSTNYTVNTFVSLFNCLYDYASEGTSANYTLNLGSTNLAKLTDEQIAIAVNKGWTLQ